MQNSKTNSPNSPGRQAVELVARQPTTLTVEESQWPDVQDAIE